MGFGVDSTRQTHFNRPGSGGVNLVLPGLFKPRSSRPEAPGKD